MPRTIATNVTLHHLQLMLWGHIWKRTEEKSQTNATRKYHFPRIWHHFFENADALIFVVDSQDRARLNKDRAWVRSGGQKVDWGRSAVQQDRPARVDKPARLIIRVLWFLFLIVFVKSEVRKQIGRRWHCLCQRWDFYRRVGWELGLFGRRERQWHIQACSAGLRLVDQ